MPEFKPVLEVTNAFLSYSKSQYAEHPQVTLELVVAETNAYGGHGSSSRLVLHVYHHGPYDDEPAYWSAARPTIDGGSYMDAEDLTRGLKVLKLTTDRLAKVELAAGPTPDCWVYLYRLATAWKVGSFKVMVGSGGSEERQIESAIYKVKKAAEEYLGVPLLTA